MKCNRYTSYVGSLVNITLVPGAFDSGASYNLVPGYGLSPVRMTHMYKFTFNNSATVTDA